MENLTNLTIWEYLEVRLGPQNMQTVVVLPISVLYVLIFISGCIGNFVVCMVIARNSHFQTPTNYYLFSLAISDLLILVFGLPNDLKVYWQQYPWGLGEPVCKMRALIAEMTSYASVLTIVAFTIERYIAICHPLFIQTVSTLPRAIKFITSVWVVSCLCALPFAYFTKVNYIDYPPGSGIFVEESAFCGLPMQIQHITRPLLQTATFVFFLLPLTLILVLYTKISLKLRSTKFARMTYKTTSPTSSTSKSIGGSQHRKTGIRRSVNKMLIAVVIAFFVCWAPFHAQRLLAVYVAPEEWTTRLRITNEILYYAAGCFYYFSATVNPILYTSLSSKYRGAFRSILCCIARKKSSNGSFFPTTQHPQTDAGQSEKEPSVRVAKQSFDADASLCPTNMTPDHNSSSNKLSVPGKGSSFKDYGSIEKRRSNWPGSYSVEADQAAQKKENDCHMQSSLTADEQSILEEESKRLIYDATPKSLKKDVIVNTEGQRYHCSVDESQGLTKENGRVKYRKRNETLV